MPANLPPAPIPCPQMRIFFAFAHVPLGLVALLCGGSIPAQGPAQAAPPVDAATHRIAYTAVVPVAHASPADLRQRAQAWARPLGPSDLLPGDPGEPGTESVRAACVRPFTYLENGAVHVLALHFTARLAARAGRYRYELTDFVFVYPANPRGNVTRISAESFYNGAVTPVQASGARYNQTMRTCFAEAAQEVQDQLKAAMSQPASQTGTGG